jgi:hypothetical protein
VCRNGPEGAHRRTEAKKSHNLTRTVGQARCQAINDTREHAGDSQGSRLPAEVITESGNIA